MHISETDIASFYDDLLTGVDRKKILAHLDECKDCYMRVTAITETIAASEFIEEENPEKIFLEKAYKTAGLSETYFWDRIFQLPAARKSQFAFAGIGIIIAILAFYLNFEDNTQHAYRDMNGNETLQVSFPENGTNVTSDKIIFRWKEEPNILTYNFILYDTKGEIIFKTSANSNEFVMDKTNGLSRGKIYLWMVEAIHKDGSKTQSHLTSFSYGIP